MAQALKVFNSIGPNPHVVRMFAAEKGVPLELVAVDLMGGENRGAEHLARNPFGQTPALELADGSYLTEITAICEYLDELKAEPALIGATPEARARTRMWTRRLDLNIVEPMANGFRFAEGLALFKDRVTCIPEAAPALKGIARRWLRWLDQDLGHREFISPDGLTLADILLFCFISFGAEVGQPLEPENTVLAAWYERMKARPSATA